MEARDDERIMYRSRYVPGCECLCGRHYDLLYHPIAIRCHLESVSPKYETFSVPRAVCPRTCVGWYVCTALDSSTNKWLPVIQGVLFIGLPLFICQCLMRLQILNVCIRFRIITLRFTNYYIDNNTGANIFAMVELFAGIIAAIMITMRRCLQDLANFVHTAIEALGSFGKENDRSDQFKTWKGCRSDPEQLLKIAVTTEIEIESTNRSTDGLILLERAYYNPGGTKENV